MQNLRQRKELFDPFEIIFEYLLKDLIIVILAKNEYFLFLLKFIWSFFFALTQVCLRNSKPGSFSLVQKCCSEETFFVRCIIFGNVIYIPFQSNDIGKFIPLTFLFKWESSFSLFLPQSKWIERIECFLKRP